MCLWRKGGGEGLKQRKDTRIMSVMKVADTLLPLSLHPTCLRVPLTEPPRSVTTPKGLFPQVCPSASSPQLLKRTSTWNQCHSFNHSVNEGEGGLWRNMGRGSASFYCHEFLRIHFCNRRILQCMLRLGFNLYIRV